MMLIIAYFSFIYRDPSRQLYNTHYIFSKKEKKNIIHTIKYKYEKYGLESFFIHLVRTLEKGITSKKVAHIGTATLGL